MHELYVYTTQHAAAFMSIYMRSTHACTGVHGWLPVWPLHMQAVHTYYKCVQTMQRTSTSTHNGPSGHDKPSPFPKLSGWNPFIIITVTDNIQDGRKQCKLTQCAETVGSDGMLLWLVLTMHLLLMVKLLKYATFICTPQQGLVAVTTQALPPPVSTADCSISVWGRLTLCRSPFCSSHCLPPTCTGPMDNKQFSWCTYKNANDQHYMHHLVVSTSVYCEHKPHHVTWPSHDHHMTSAT